MPLPSHLEPLRRLLRKQLKRSNSKIFFARKIFPAIRSADKLAQFITVVKRSCASPSWTGHWSSATADRLLPANAVSGASSRSAHVQPKVKWLSCALDPCGVGGVLGSIRPTWEKHRIAIDKHLVLHAKS